jgi:hypothetical protein
LTLTEGDRVAAIGEIEVAGDQSLLWVFPHWRTDDPVRLDGGSIPIDGVAVAFERAFVSGVWVRGGIRDSRVTPVGTAAVPSVEVLGTGARELGESGRDAFITDLEQFAGRALLAVGGSTDVIEIQVLALTDDLRHWFTTRGVAATVFTSVWPDAGFAAPTRERGQPAAQ